MDRARTVGGFVACCLLAACNNSHQPAGEHISTRTDTYVMDPHTFARPDKAVITHLNLDIRVDMGSERIEGTATYDIQHHDGDTIVFDTDGLDIRGVNVDGRTAAFSVGDSSFLGRPLRVQLPKEAKQVAIDYATGPHARALQWLSPAQTGGKKRPFLFTQGEAIMTRSWIPIQDSPGIRFTYDAQVQVPTDLMAVMSASNPTERSADGRYSFRMDQPIPAYLMALSVGDIAFTPIGDRTGVYAETGAVKAAAWELADMEKMLAAAEDLYGPYRWERYDVIVLPPSFPFGGMENPRLTFATPTIIAGDRSLTALIAHELAHSWSGNLVTNATWDDFWLNEGFTVYFERRISEKLYGKEYADMLALLGYQDLLRTVAEIDSGGHPEDTRLKLDLAGRDPDEGMTDVAYEKGYSLLRLLEEKVGREKFDAFLKTYFNTFAFQGMTTEHFLTYLKEELLVPDGVDVDVDRWVYKPGLPDDLIVSRSDKFMKVEEEIARWNKGTSADELATKGWTTFEWMHFLRHLPVPLPADRMAELDTAFGFTKSGNSEILAAWLEQCIRSGYHATDERLKEFLTTVGRRKFLIPLYQAMIATPAGRAQAERIYAAARPNYHSVSTRKLDEMLSWKGQAQPATL